MSKLIKVVVFLGVAGLAAFFPLRWLVARVSAMPNNLGVENGRLAPCPTSPNCVSSEATDKPHYIEPMAYDGETAVAHQKIVSIIKANDDLTLISQTPTYIHAEARSNLWHFIDDVEFYFDEAAGLVQLRSASRLGYGDGGVNRRRLEAIRTAFAAPN